MTYSLSEEATAFQPVMGFVPIGRHDLRILARSVILTGAASAALAIANPALAQDASRPVQDDPATRTGTPTPSQATPEPSEDDIIVTAQRRQERLQDVPIAISAFTSDERNRLGIISPQSLANFTPGASLSTLGLSIRGVGRYTSVLGSDPGVAIYTDGFYSPDPALLGQSTLFVERIEILRGPQGTLFGRNSIGGSADIISRRPAKTTGGEFRIGAGNYGSALAGGTFTGPITDDLRFRVGFQKDIRRDGFVRNVVPGAGDLADENTLYVEGQLEWDIGPDVQAWVKYSHTEFDRSASLGESRVLVSPYFNRTFFPPASLVPAGQYGYGDNISAVDPYRVALDDPGRSRLTGEHRVVGQFVWNLGSVSLRYRGGYETGRTDEFGDYDRTPRASYVVPAGGPDPQQPPPGSVIGSRYIYRTGQTTSYNSNELSLSGSSDAFTWIVGANHYRESLKQPYALSAPDVAVLYRPLLLPSGDAAPNPNGDFYSQYGTLRTRSSAVFGQADLRVTRAFELSAGLRYTHDEKIGTEQFRLIYWNPVDGGRQSATCCAYDVSPAVNSRRLEDSWQGLSGRLSINWKPDGDTLGYASYSRGYKSGGFQLGQIAQTATVKAENLNAYEVGLKKTLGRFRFGSSAFYYDYRNFQVPVTILRGTGPAGSITQSQFVNAERARALGAEIEMTWKPTRSLGLIANYSYLDAKSLDFCCVLDITRPEAGNQDLSGNPLPQSPRHKIAAGASYEFFLPVGTLGLAVTNSYVGSQYYSPFAIERYRGKAYNVTDFTVYLYDSEDRYQVNLFARNAFDTRYITGLSLGPASVDSPRQIVPSDPRTYGFEVRFKF